MPPPKEPDEVLLAAHQALESGDPARALALAGEVLWLDKTRLDGPLLIAWIHEVQDEIELAHKAYEQTAKKARGLALRDDGETFRSYYAEALDGLARIQLQIGDFEHAMGTLRELEKSGLVEREVLRPRYAELYLLLGDPTRGYEEAVATTDPDPDAWLLAGLAALELGRIEDAVIPLRQAFLANPWFISSLCGDEPPDLGFEPEDMVEGPEYAMALAQRLFSWLEMRPERLAQILALVAAEPVAFEIQKRIDIAVELVGAKMDLESVPLRQKLIDLRSVSRLELEKDAAVSAVKAR